MTNIIELILNLSINASIKIISDKNKPLLLRITFPLAVFGLMVYVSTMIIIASIKTGNIVITLLLIVIFSTAYISIALKIKEKINKQ